MKVCYDMTKLGVSSHVMYRSSDIVEADACAVSESQANLEPRLTNYREVVLNITSGLGSRDLCALKFLCSDLIPLGTLERLKLHINLIDELENLSLISPPNNVTFLAELLWHIGRIDLVEKNLGLTSKDVEYRLIPNRRLFHLSPYRVMLHNLCQELTKEECSKLKYLCELRNAQLQSINEPQDLFTVLEIQRKISMNNLSYLPEKLRQLRREDLARKVDIYCVEIRVTKDIEHHDIKERVTADRVSSTNRVVSFLPAESRDLQLIRTQYSQLEEDVTNSSPGLDVTAVSRHCVDPYNGAVDRRNEWPVDESIVGRLNNLVLGGERPEPRNYEGAPQESELLYYSMKRKPRGICLIISNQFFYKVDEDPDSRLMSSREGTQNDQESLVKTFERLQFSVQVRNDLTAAEMARCLSDVSREDHSSYDCFVCCILSHGALGCVYGIDGRTVSIRDLMSEVKPIKCPSLRGKPKLFFIQACQGNDKQPGFDVETDAAVRDAAHTEMIPNEADFLLGLSTVPGFVSYRSRSQGSWYITTLVRMLDLHAHRHDLLSVLTQVNFEVSKAFTKEGSFRQVPQPQFTLRKRILFE